MEDRYNDANVNYMGLENKLKAIISRCSDKNVTDVYADDSEFIPTDLYYKGIQNCTSVDTFVVDGIYVYRVLKYGEPIDYLISHKPLYSKEIVNESKGNRTMKVVCNEYPFLEYSCGGLYNSISIKVATGDKYTIPKFIGLCHDGNTAVPDVRVNEGGSSLKVEGASGIGDYVKYVLNGSNRDTVKACNTGDLFGYINSIKPDYNDSSLLIQYKALITRVDEVAIGYLKEELKEQKKLINQILRNKKSSSDYDPFKLTLKK